MSRLALLIGGIAAALASSASAQYSQNSPDHPNTCTVASRSADGSVTLQCRNAFTGAMWTETQHPSGSQSGTNSSGQQWTYDANRRTYDNAPAGKHCTYAASGQRLCN